MHSGDLALLALLALQLIKVYTISQFWADHHPTVQRNCSTAHIGSRLATQEQTCARYIFRFANATQGNVLDHCRFSLTQGSSHHLTTEGATCQSVGPRGNKARV